MFVAINYIVSLLGTWISFILNLPIPTGINNGFIRVKTIVLFMFLCPLAWMVIKLFLTKGFHRYGKD